ncbi:MAG: methyltransferase domain-containing protein [Rhodocyclales bacterium]|nr:methyltransferase domain-containing protein [Rhodocyclales bacterium]
MPLTPAPRHWRVVLIQPPAYEHSGALAELAETLLYGLHGLGMEVDLALNECSPTGGNIVLGAHLLDEREMAALPGDAVIYNSEQIDEGSTWIGRPYVELLRSRPVWDYSRQNLERLRFLGVAGGTFVPVGYVPQLTRIPREEEDIDVLFYGCINERRKKILEGLIERGLRIEFLSGVYREPRDHLIARAKVVLNLHYYDANVFEIVRVSYLLANEKAVVAECGDTTDIDEDMRDAVRGVPYEQLVDACVELVDDAKQRANLARRGFEAFARRSERDILAQTLGIADAVSPTHTPALLNLGSGKDWRDNCLNVDISEVFRPDALLDIGRPIPAGAALDTIRFGRIDLRSEMFDAIFANDVLEHIPDLVTAMGNCLTLLKAGGTFHIVVPYDLSLGAWQDPTHLRAFNENSWLYYTDWYWYLGWAEARFDRLSTEFALSPLGQSLQQAGKPLEEILRTPRAVDSMSVVLRKRYLLESEAQRASVATRRPWDDIPA